jgi:acetyl esterase/lipase
MADLDDLTQMPVVYAIPGMESASVRKNITYKRVDGDELKMDVYYPANFQGGSRLPAVIFIHGDAEPEFIKKC